MHSVGVIAKTESRKIRMSSRTQSTPGRRARAEQAVPVVTPSPSNSSADRGTVAVTTPPNSAAANGLAAAKDMMDKRVKPSTKSGYCGRMKFMINWFRENPMYEDETCTTRVEFFEDENTLKLPLPVDAVLAFFGFLGGQKFDKDGNISPDGDQLKATSTMGGYRSALVDYYKQRGKRFDGEVDTMLQGYMAGYRRSVTDLKLDGVMSTHEGKHPLTFEAYRMIARRLFTLAPQSRSGAWTQQLFAWPFFIFCWNLMARSVMVGHIMYQHMSWNGDALIVEIPGHKGDLEGAKSFGRHVYANPLQPDICPILCLAVLVFSGAYRQTQQVFEGKHSESRFSAILRSVVDNLTDAEMKLIGGCKKNIGTHSPRKGAPTHALSQVEGPSAVQVFQRAGWSLGNVPDRYLWSGKGGDQLVGRTVCGLPMSDEKFSTLPPHFPHAILETLAEADWAGMLENYAAYTPAFRGILPFLLASLVYHDDWLHENLDCQHPLFDSRVYASGRVSTLKSSVLVGQGHCPVTDLRATGVPANIVIARNVKQLSERVDELESGCKRRHEETIDMLREELPKRLKDDLLQNFAINGAVPVTMDAMREMIDSRFSQMEALLRSGTGTQAAPVPAGAPGQATVPAQTFSTWTWGGRIHMVPEGFAMPECSVKTLWDLWHFGHCERRIQPYKHLKGFDLLTRAGRSELSKARAVVTSIYIVAIEKGLRVGASSHARLSECVSSGSVSDSDTLFNAAFTALVGLLYPNRSTDRVGEIRFNTVYNKLPSIATVN